MTDGVGFLERDRSLPEVFNINLRWDSEDGTQTHEQTCCFNL